MYIKSETTTVPSTCLHLVGSAATAVRSVVLSMPFLEAVFFLAIIAATV